MVLASYSKKYRYKKSEVGYRYPIWNQDTVYEYNKNQVRVQVGGRGDQRNLLHFSRGTSLISAKLALVISVHVTHCLGYWNEENYEI